MKTFVISIFLLCVVFFYGVFVGEVSSPTPVSMVVNIETIPAPHDLYNNEYNYGYLTGVQDAMEARKNNSVLQNATSMHGAGISTDRPCFSALCIGKYGWNVTATNLAVNIEDKEKRVYIGPNDNPNIVWADELDPNTSTMPSYGEGEFYVEGELGVKLLVKQMQSPDGKYHYDIYALPDKKEIYGNTNRTDSHNPGNGTGK